MMKAVMLSIKPKYCELIASGKKTVEVRKTKPKLETPFKCYIYCTKSRGEALWKYRGEYYYDTQFPNERPNKANGKVIGEFVCKAIYELHDWHLDPRGAYQEIEEENLKKLLKTTQLTYDELCIYRNGMPYYKPLYAWHISDFVIYDKPKELSEFYKSGVLSYDDWLYGIYNGTAESSYDKYLLPFKKTRPLQSWCYVEDLEV